MESSDSDSEILFLATVIEAEEEEQRSKKKKKNGMSQEKFYELLDMIRPDIEKQDTKFRLAIPSEERLVTCLR
ncbi:protein ALP1-like [Aphis craccivora]|uniref:Protein ALP1-like n=1 Tax=Aphis craccivora TaxID=307492 RepID=A0A6G0VVP1_APHCR|nr:protein ALP1-like [Aphis craccivora]